MENRGRTNWAQLTVALPPQVSRNVTSFGSYRPEGADQGEGWPFRGTTQWRSPASIFLLNVRAILKVGQFREMHCGRNGASQVGFSRSVVSLVTVKGEPSEVE